MAVIWFEPGLEALVPVNRRQNKFSRSNWIDNPNLQRLSRVQALLAIERCKTVEEVIGLMCPGEGTIAKYWNFNFLAILKYSTIEFRKAPPSLNEQMATAWMEFALRFIIISMTYGTAEFLQKAPATVGGLHQFLSQTAQFAQLGIFNDQTLNPLFEGVPPSTSIQPRPVPPLSPEDQAAFKAKVLFDTQHQDLLNKKLLPPYFNVQLSSPLPPDSSPLTTAQAGTRTAQSTADLVQTEQSFNPSFSTAPSNPQGGGFPMQ